MGREVRMVAPDWQHPKDEQGRLIPLIRGSWIEDRTEWLEGARRWALGERPDWYTGDGTETFEEYESPAPRHIDYMPVWPDGEATMLMMYEDTSEGTPISPAFATPEELAQWLADSGASAFGDMTATYDQWLATCRLGYAPSMVMAGSRMMSGVAASTEMNKP